MISPTSEMVAESHKFSDPLFLLSTLQKLRQSVETGGKNTFDRWQVRIQRPEFLASALNLAQYLALRRHDLRSLQVGLMPWGLSSLGRIEARVMPNLDAVIATLAVICGSDSVQLPNRPSIESFIEGTRLLRQHTEELFGPSLPHRRVRIMVTLATEAATNYEMVLKLIQRGARCIRINCAHDSPEAWERMIAHVRKAELETGSSCKIMMDLGGPKIRTGFVVAPPHAKRLFQGDLILLSRSVPNSRDAVKEEATLSATDKFQISCTVPDILDLLEVNAPVYIDDGKVRTRVADVQYPLSNGQSAILLEVTHASPKGGRLRSEKGLNFPNTALSLSPLTEKDLDDLDFVAAHADIIGYSFVQKPADIELIQQELDNRTGEQRP